MPSQVFSLTQPVVLTVTSGNASEQYGWLGNSTAFRNGSATE
ncbi:hypothetical protein CSB95_0014 [Pseudomonas aeruginosa]|nr:hypothetical protein CSB95_0014 [Pseudomonas aeruginosa]